MLVLNRKQEQSVLIGSDIEVRVLGVSGSTVKLGFSAPRGVQIVRDELRTRPEGHQPRGTGQE